MPTINNRFENLTLERLQEIYDLIITPGSIGLSVGVTPITGGAVGRILFEGAGNVLQESSNLFWDNVNNRLGIGTASPSAIIHSVGSVTAATAIARGNYLQPTLVASANNDVLVGLDIQPTFTNGAFTGVQNVAIQLNSNANIKANGFINAYNINLNTSSTTLNGAGGGINFQIFTGNVGRFFSTGNLLLQNGGTFTDAGYRLDVNGTARIQGTVTITPTANTSAIVSTGYSVTGSGTTAMLSFNGTVNTTGNITPYIFDVTHTASGSGSFLAQFRRNGSYLWGIGLNDGLIYSTNHVSITGSWQIFARENAINGVVIRSTNPSTHTSGSRNHFSAQESFAPTSGTGTYTSILSSPTINQTGGANGITRGLYIQPVLTAAADWRAIEVSSGGAYINTTSVVASAILQADSTTKGFLPPRMTTAQRTAIVTPAAGLVVYDTTLNALYTYNGTSWVASTAGASSATYVFNMNSFAVPNSSLFYGVYLGGTPVSPAVVATQYGGAATDFVPGYPMPAGTASTLVVILRAAQAAPTSPVYVKLANTSTSTFGPVVTIPAGSAAGTYTDNSATVSFAANERLTIVASNPFISGATSSGTLTTGSFRYAL